MLSKIGEQYAIFAVLHFAAGPPDLAAILHVDRRGDAADAIAMLDEMLPPSWHDALDDVICAPEIAALDHFLTSEAAAGKVIYPAPAHWFRALALTPLNAVRVVILGQDPYHGPDQAHGLSFSVQPGVRIPPSLRNIYKEMESDLAISPAKHGFLEHWAQQGVLLLNAVLTVESGKAASHQKRGWEALTDAIIAAVNREAEPSAFLLWGAHAQKKAALIDTVEQGGRHRILAAPHPSPLSAYQGFFGSRPFSQANAFLGQQGRGAIDWQIPSNSPEMIDLFDH